MVAIDPSAAFKRAIAEQLPNAKISVDQFHLMQLANLMLTRVRQRLVRERELRRGRKIDPAWAHRTLLLRGYDTLSERGQDRLVWVFATDDPTDELSAAWGVKEQLRRLLASGTVATARTEKMILGCYVLAADMEESWRFWTTIEAWWSAIEVLIIHRVTNARSEAANTSVKHIKRTGRGYRNPAYYQVPVSYGFRPRRRAQDAVPEIHYYASKAEKAVAGQAAVKRNRFVQLTGATKSVNRDLEAKARALAGLKGLCNEPGGADRRVCDGRLSSAVADREELPHVQD